MSTEKKSLQLEPANSFCKGIETDKAAPLSLLKTGLSLRADQEVVPCSFVSGYDSIIIESLLQDPSQISTQEDIDKSLQRELQKEFTPRKRLSEVLAYALDRISKENKSKSYLMRSARVDNCGSFLEFALKEEKWKLQNANFCRDRLCPMCQRRRSLKMFSQVSKIMDILFDREQFGSLRFGFATFTCKNCSDEELPSVITQLLDAFHKMTAVKRKLFRSDAIAGTFRSLEVKRSKDGKGWHPHLHCIFAFTQKYFEGRSGLYMNQKEWSSLWRDCMGIDYDPVIDIRMIRNYDKEKTEIVTIDDLKKAVAECAKYSVKATDFLLVDDLDQTVKLVKTLTDALSGRRLYGFTGCFSKVRKQLKLDDIEDGDLVHTEVEINHEIVYQIKRFSWYGYGIGYVEV